MQHYCWLPIIRSDPIEMKLIDDFSDASKDKLREKGCLRDVFSLLNLKLDSDVFECALVCVSTVIRNNGEYSCNCMNIHMPVHVHVFSQRRTKQNFARRIISTD